MSASSAVWNSLMNSAHVVCIDHRLTMPFPDVELADEVHDPFGEVDELDAPVGLHEHGIGMDDEGPRHGRGLHWRVPDGRTRALGHQLMMQLVGRPQARIAGSRVRGRNEVIDLSGDSRG